MHCEGAERTNATTGFDRSVYESLLDKGCAHIRTYKAGEEIVINSDMTTDMTTQVILLIKGKIKSVLNCEDGKEISMVNLEQGSLVCPDLILDSDQRKLLRMFAVKPVTLLYADQARLRDCKVELLDAASYVLAKRIGGLYRRLWIYSQAHIRDRLRIYLTGLPHDGDFVELPMTQKDLACYLGVDRSALCREITRMKKEGILELKGRSVYVLDHAFLGR